MASEEDLLGNEYKEFEDLEELDADAEEALLAPSDDDDGFIPNDQNRFYGGENEELLQQETSVYGSHIEDDVLDLQPDGDPEFETLSENTSKIHQNEEEELVVQTNACEEEFQEFEKPYNEVNEKAEEKNESSESEDENESGRGRFRRERINIISLSTAKQRNDIPDSLDAIINTEPLNTNKTPMKQANTKPNVPQKPWMGNKNKCPYNNNNNNNNEQMDRWRGQNLTFKMRQFGRMQMNQPNKGRNQTIGRVQYQNEINPRILAHDMPPFSNQNKKMNEQQSSGSRNIHINPKFAQSVPCSREGSRQLQDCERPFTDVTSVHQDSFRPSYPVANRQNMYNDNRRQSISNKSPGIGPRPYLLEKPPAFPFGSDRMQFPLNQPRIPQPQHMPPQPPVSLIPNVNIPIQTPPLRNNFTPLTCTSSNVYHPPLMTVDPQRPTNFTQNIPPNDQSLFSERYNFHENVNNWKQIPMERVQPNNFCQFPAPVINSRENSNLLVNPNIQHSHPQQFMQNSSVVSYPWQNPPPTQQNNFPEPQQQQQQALLQPTINSLPFPNLQIRPDIQQKMRPSQQYQNKPQSNLGVSSFENMKGNMKSNPIRNKNLSGNSGSVLTVIKTLSEQQLKQVNAIKQKQRTSNLKQLKTVSTVRKRPAQDIFSSGPVKQIKIEKLIPGKNQKQNKSNIKEIKLLDTLPKQPDQTSNNIPVLPKISIAQGSNSQMSVTDTSPSAPKSTLPPEDEEDEETRILREKIEEQKKKREEFLKLKERRRQLMAEQRRKEIEKRNLSTNSASGNPILSNIPVTDNLVPTGKLTKLSVKQRLQSKPFANQKNLIPTNVSKQLVNVSQSNVNQNLKTIGQFPKDNNLNFGLNHPAKKIGFLQRPRFQGNVTTGHINMLRKKYNLNFPQKKNFPNVIIKNIPKVLQGQQKNISVLPIKQVSGSNVIVSPGIQNNLIFPPPQNIKFINNLPSALRQISPQFNNTIKNFEGKPIHTQQINRIPVNCAGPGRGHMFKRNTVPEYLQRRPVNTRAIGLLADPPQQDILAQKINNLHQFQIKQQQQQQNTLLGPRFSKTNANIPVLHRKIITNPSRMVIIENLAASTTEPQITKMCEGIGTVESIDYNHNERKAAVKFQNPEDAEEFKKKFQRRMIDLSLINVTLLPA